jgi:trehalose 6-phosphate phosphatase
LARYAWSRTLLAFDFDGTLAPIVERPADARMRATTHARLCVVAERYPCVVISGRGLADTKSRLAGMPTVSVVGNHGLEPSSGMREHARTVSDWLPRLHHLQAEPGVEIEDKKYSLAIHYRRSRRKRVARALIANAVAALGPAVRAIEGKQVLNVVPHGAPHKGMALERLRAEVGADTAVYVGDDVTDEDVFGLDQPGRLLSIRVGASTATVAPYYLRNQLEIDRLLEVLLELRADSASHRVDEP